MKRCRAVVLSLACLLTRLSPALAAPAEIVVDVNGKGHAVPKTLFGIFFEEINRAGDGGIYAEMLLNRGFEDGAGKLTGWTVTGGDAGTVSVVEEKRSEFNRQVVRIDAKGGGPVGIVNEGFKGLAVKSGASYIITFDAKGSTAGGSVTVAVEGADGAVLASGSIGEIQPAWGHFTVQLAPTTDAGSAKVRVTVEQAGTYWLDNVSMVPAETWKGHGLRADLMELIDGMKPGFVRFPGGCWVEGNVMADAYRWKTTIGPVADRRTVVNLWRYKSTNGLGFHEYLQMCEDLGAEPLFVINVGMSHRETVPMDGMGEYVQDALDAIEYANGPADSVWGKKRAEAGHPAPFGLKYMEIGNENGGPKYDERFALFHDAIKAKHPEMHLVSDLWGGLPKSRPNEIIDEHYYMTPGWFAANATKYDSYDRKGPKVYVGEYAVTKGGQGNGNLRAAVGEAAFMTGMERNSDIVVMASYAPLLSRVGYKVWNPDAIYFDASRACGTPSYWVQRMFGESRPDVTVPVSVKASVSAVAKSGTVGIGTWRTQAEFKDLKGVDGSGKELYSNALSNGPGDLIPLAGKWEAGDGAVKQTGDGEGAFLTAPPIGSGEYTLTVKARKTGGREGFLIRLHSADKENYTMWNVGGWKNNRTAIEVSEGGVKSELGSFNPTRIETGRWYDIKVEATPNGVKCHLDGQLVQEERYGAAAAMFACAGKRDGEVIVKVVNVADEPQETVMMLDGLASASQATINVLAGKPGDENTVEQPNNIVPAAGEVRVENGVIKHTFPGRSVSVIRVK